MWAFRSLELLGGILLVAGYVAHILIRQISDTIYSSGVTQSLAGTVSWGVGNHDSGSLQSYEMAVQARPGNAGGTHKFSGCARTQQGKLTKNIRLRPASNYAHGSLNLRREVWIDEGGHISIMPDTTSLTRVMAIPYY
jgi:hypothetical protein